MRPPAISVSTWRGESRCLTWIVRSPLLDGEFVGVGQGGAQVGEVQDVARPDLLQVLGVGELERQHPEVDQVLPVDAGVGLGDDHRRPR